MEREQTKTFKIGKIEVWLFFSYDHLCELKSITSIVPMKKAARVDWGSW
jgi:hypothetical protein